MYIHDLLFWLPVVIRYGQSVFRTLEISNFQQMSIFTFASPSIYDLITLFKWLFLIGLIFNFPLGINQFLEVNWNNLPLQEAVLPMLYVVICTTFMTYFLNGFALTRLTSSEVAVFVYLQPIIGVAFALFSNSDRLSLTIIIASILIFTGLYLTTKKNNL